VETASPDSAPAALADLIAAGLVSHEMIGDPARLGSEPAALSQLCALIAGPVWRIEPFHYAFRAGPADLGGALGRADRADWAARLEAALQEALGADAVWISATDLVPAAAPLDQPLLVLRAQAEAVEGALAAAPAELQAVIGARFAAATARLVAGEAGPLAERLAAVEARQMQILALLEAQAAADPAADDVADVADLAADLVADLAAELAPVTEALAAVAARLDAQGGREEMIAGRLAELAAVAGRPAAFQETLGVTLAEFLARLERREEALQPTRVPQFL
jgi:hypothetical protein